MSQVAIIDSNGLMTTVPGTLQVIRADNPAYRARIAIALPLNKWLYAPTKGHSLDQFKNVQATPANLQNFSKSVKLYLAPYGAQIIDTFLSRGVEGLTVQVSKETIYG